MWISSVIDIIQTYFEEHTEGLRRLAILGNRTDEVGMGVLIEDIKEVMNQLYVNVEKHFDKSSPETASLLQSFRDTETRLLDYRQKKCPSYYEEN